MTLSGYRCNTSQILNCSKHQLNNIPFLSISQSDKIGGRCLQWAHSILLWFRGFFTCSQATENNLLRDIAADVMKKCTFSVNLYCTHLEYCIQLGRPRGVKSERQNYWSHFWNGKDLKKVSTQIKYRLSYSGRLNIYIYIYIYIWKYHLQQSLANWR